VFLGELGALAFLWVFVEVLQPNAARMRRARLVALGGTALLMSAWVVGGFYYVDYYGANVKPAIKEGPEPWAHKVVMEVKEHVFLLIPFLAIVTTMLLSGLDPTDKRNRRSLLALSATTFGLGLLMAFLGFIISGGYRAALGGA
jgi:hypothetical protein